MIQHRSTQCWLSIFDSNSSGDGTYVSSWTYLNDSAVANMQSAPNKKSQITPSNRMNIRVRYLGRVGVEACMILGDGEQFAGNSYDTTNYVRVYAYGEEVGRFSYKPGISKQTDSASFRLQKHLLTVSEVSFF